MTEREASRGAASRLRSTGEALRGGGRGWLLLAVALGWLLTLGLRYVLPALLPYVKEAFAVDNTTAGFAITLVWLTYALMQLPAGALVDRLGERALLSASVAIAAGGIVLFGIAPTFALFLVACAVFGLGTGLYGPPRATVLSNTYPDNDGAAFGIVLAAGNVGSTAMPVIASLVAVRFGWRAALVVFVPAFALMAAGMYRTVPATTVEAGGESRSPREYAGDLRDAVSRRPVVVGVAAVTLMLFALQGLTAFLPTYLVEVKGLSPSLAGTLFAVFFAVGAVTKLVAGGAADRYGHRTVLVAAAAVGALPLVALPFAAGLPALAAVSALAGLRLGVAPVSNAYLVRVLPADVQGTAWGLLRALFFLLASAGSVFVGALADRGLFDRAFLALGGLTAVAAGLYLLLPPRDRVAV